MKTSRMGVQAEELGGGGPGREAGKKDDRIPAVGRSSGSEGETRNEDTSWGAMARD